MNVDAEGAAWALRGAVGRVRDAVREAYDARTPLAIRGRASRSPLAMEPSGRPLGTELPAGIVDYQPAELVVTVDAGTPLAEVEGILAAQGQMLAFEPPHFGAGATVGGTIAIGAAGPRRPWGAAVRDHLLGARVVLGDGRAVRLGGTVIKNVAGFDLARSLVGAWGTLGVVVQASLRVAPRPAEERCFASACSAAEWLAGAWASPQARLPISAASHVDGCGRLRLSGAPAAVAAAFRALGGGWQEEDGGHWPALRERSLEWFRRPGTVWLYSVPRHAPPGPEALGDWLLDWGGARRWLRTRAQPEAVRAQARLWGGAVSGPHPAADQGLAPVALTDDPVLTAAWRRIRSAFDPAGICNPAFADRLATLPAPAGQAAP